MREVYLALGFAVLLLLALSLTGCQTLRTAVDEGAKVQDGAVEAAEVTLCRGISIGAWMRAYGQDATKAKAWKTLCEERIKETP